MYSLTHRTEGREYVFHDALGQVWEGPVRKEDWAMGMSIPWWTWAGPVRKEDWGIGMSIPRWAWEGPVRKEDWGMGMFIPQWAWKGSVRRRAKGWECLFTDVLGQAWGGPVTYQQYQLHQTYPVADPGFPKRVLTLRGRLPMNFSRNLHERLPTNAYTKKRKISSAKEIVPLGIEPRTFGSLL